MTTPSPPREWALEARDRENVQYLDRINLTKVYPISLLSITYCLLPRRSCAVAVYGLRSISP